MANQKNQISGKEATDTGGTPISGSPSPASGQSKQNVGGTSVTSPGKPGDGRDVGSRPMSSTGVTGTAAATARSFIDQAKETAGQAYEAVTEKAATKLDEQKSTLTGDLSTVADSIRQVGQNLKTAPSETKLAETAAQYTDTVARRIEQATNYFNTHDVRAMVRDLEGFGRRNPALFIGGAFALGFLASRFLKSSPPGSYNAGQDFMTASASERGESGAGASARNTGSTRESMDRPM